MGKLLKEITDNLPVLQVRQIERDLLSLERAGNFQSFAEKKAYFQTRLREILDAARPIRYRQFSLNEGTKIHSEQFTEMFRLFGTDLSSVYEDIDTIIQLTDIQEEMFTNKAIARLEQAVALVEKRLTTLEILMGISTARGVLYDTFTSASRQEPRGNPLDHLLFVDPKGPHRVSPEASAATSPEGGLRLSVQHSTALPISSITEIEYSDTLGGLALSLPPNFVPSTDSDTVAPNHISPSVLAGRNSDQMWQKVVLKNKDYSGKVFLSLLVDLGGTRELNAIELIGSSDIGTSIESIYYYDSSNLPINMEITATPLRSKTDLSVSSIRTRRILITMSQEAGPDVSVEGKVYSSYTFSLGRILIGQQGLEANGYFVSETISEESVTRLTLSSTTDHQGDSVIDQSSLPTIEHWIHIRDIDKFGNMLFGEYVPIMSTNLSVKVEQIYPNGDGLATTCFQLDEAHVANETLAPEVYRNGTLLVEGVDYTIPEDGNLEADRGHIQLSQASQLVASHYVAAYAPKFMTVAAGTDVRDGTQLFKYNKDGSIDIIRPPNNKTVSTEINLLSIIRGEPTRRLQHILAKAVLVLE